MSAGHDATRMRLDGFDGRVAVITGGARGIGRRIAEAVAAQGAKVAVIDSDIAEDAAQLLSVVADVRDASAIDGVCSQIERDLGAIDMLVTAAGIFRPMPFEELTPELFRETVDVNLTGSFLCARRALPGMRERSFGRVITISSGAGLDGGTEASAHYATSKAGVIVLAKSLSKEYAPHGVDGELHRTAQHPHPHDRGARGRPAGLDARRAGSESQTTWPPRPRSCCRPTPPTSPARCWSSNGGWW